MNLHKHKHAIAAGVAAALLSVGSILLWFVFYADLKDATNTELERQQNQLATIAAEEVEQYFYGVQKRLETIALMPIVRNATRSEVCNLELQKIVEINNQELSNLGRVSKDGTFVCAVNRTIIGEPVSKYGDYFTKIADDPQHKPAMSRLVLPAGSASMVVALHVPVFDDNGQFNGTIGGAVYFDELQKHILAGAELGSDGILAMYDNNLDILYHPDPLVRGKNLSDAEVKDIYTPQSALEHFSEQVKNAPKGGSVEYSLRGDPHQVIYKSAQVVGRYWTVAILVPLANTEAFVARQTAQNLFIAVSTLLVVAGTALTYCMLSAKRPHGSPQTKKAHEGR